MYFPPAAFVRERIRYLLFGQPSGPRQQPTTVREPPVRDDAIDRRTVRDAWVNDFVPLAFSDALAAVAVVVFNARAAREQAPWVLLVALVATTVFLFTVLRCLDRMCDRFLPKLRAPLRSPSGAHDLQVLETIQHAWMSFADLAAVATLLSYTVVGKAVAFALGDARVFVLTAGVGAVVALDFRARLARVDPMAFANPTPEQSARLREVACARSMVHRLTHKTELLSWTKAPIAPLMIAGASIGTNLSLVLAQWTLALATAGIVLGLVVIAVRYARWQRRLPLAPVVQDFYHFA